MSQTTLVTSKHNMAGTTAHLEQTLSRQITHVVTPPSSSSGHDGHHRRERNTTKTFVVVYPSNATASTRITADTPKSPASAADGGHGFGFGLCVEPKQRSRAKFWSESESEPTLFTVENYGQDGLTMESGTGAGVEDMLARIQIAEQDDYANLADYEACISQLLLASDAKRRADLAWIKECLQALQRGGFVPSFDINAFEMFVKSTMQENNLQPQPRKSHAPAPVNVSYMGMLPEAQLSVRESRRASLGRPFMGRFRNSSYMKSQPKSEPEKVLRLT